MRIASNTLVGAVAALATATLVISPTANADNDSFVNAARALGLTFQPVNLISMARSACYQISLNRDRDEVEARLGKYASLDAAGAHQFFVLSLAEYCPQFS
jgi:hypothetical protein